MFNVKKALLSVALALPLTVQAAEKLVLYTSQPNTDAQMTVDAFMKANPGIEVEWVRDGTTQLMTRLRAELSAGISKPDVLLIADSVTMESLIEEDLLQPYMSPERAGYDAALYHPEGYYYGTKMITTGIAYHTRAPHQPTSWTDLTHENLKNQVVMPSPLYSGAALIHLAALTDMDGFGWDYYQQLQVNQVSAQTGNGAVLSAITAGTKPYGILVDFMAIREAAKGAPIKFVFPTEGVTAVTEPVAIFKEAMHPEAAQKFVDFLLSSTGQALVSEQGYIPALESIALPDGFPDRSEIRLMPLDAAKALQNAEDNKKRFSEIFGS